METARKTLKHRQRIRRHADSLPKPSGRLLGRGNCREGCHLPLITSVRGPKCNRSCSYATCDHLPVVPGSLAFTAPKHISSVWQHLYQLQGGKTTAQALLQSSCSQVTTNDCVWTSGSLFLQKNAQATKPLREGSIVLVAALQDQTKLADGSDGRRADEDKHPSEDTGLS